MRINHFFGGGVAVAVAVVIAFAWARGVTYTQRVVNFYVALSS